MVSTAEPKNCDRIVMASHGRSGIRALLIRSETLKVLTHSRIPVLVVRPIVQAKPELDKSESKASST
ncbi:hypothetical protein CA601_02820 [Paraburkholderia hospita]|nr:hypothetical protein CA601_02820 [Paraburkholderia hospita]